MSAKIIEIKSGKYADRAGYIQQHNNDGTYIVNIEGTILTVTTDELQEMTNE